MANGPSNTQLSQKPRPGALSTILPAPATSPAVNSQLRSRVTRSAARLAAESAAPNKPSQSALTSQPSTSSKKRKTPHRDSSPVEEQSEPSPPSPPRRTKRQKTNNSNSPPTQPPAARSSRRTKIVTDTAMSNNGSSSKYPEEPSKIPLSKTSSKRPASKNNKKSSQGMHGLHTDTKPKITDASDATPSTQTSSIRRQKKRLVKKDVEAAVKSDDESPSKSARKPNEATPPPPQQPESDSNDGDSPNGMEDDSNDPFSTALFGSGRGPPSGLSNTLRALSGMMSGMSSRLRDILNNLRQVDNPTMQLVALEELSNLLLVSNEDNLSGQFSPDPYIKELVALMQPNPLTGEENPEMMLLACRCIANLMEALRGSVANVVYGGAVPVLCQKLLDIQYIDVAEQALSTLSKISVDFPASIVREGGLTACLQFLDFFATGTQRTAVTTAANCCRNIPHDSFPVIRDVMPILQNVLVSHDQKVVEQGCLCVTRVIDSFKRSPDKLEQLVDPALLRAILGLLLPGTTNLIGSNIHTEFLRVLAIVARASPKLSAEMLKMDIVDTLYQILTGVSPPSETADAASKIDSVVIMQALIHRPREQVYETLNVICELLPRAKTITGINQGPDHDFDDSISDDSQSPESKASRIAKRMELLKECSHECRRFAMILLPTLTDAYSSTVNLSVRQKVLTAQLKILSNLETTVIEEALRPVPYASFLASILSQEDHPSLVMFALQASELLFDRLEDIYQYQFHREGVISEIKKIASRHSDIEAGTNSSIGSAKESQRQVQATKNNESLIPEEPLNEKADATNLESHDVIEDDAEEDHEGADEDEDDDDHEDDDIVVRNDHEMDDSQSSDSSDGDVPLPTAVSGISNLVTIRAKKFLEKYENSKGRELKARAGKIRQDLQTLANEIETLYRGTTTNAEGKQLFSRLASYFDGDALESITSSELLDSGIIRVLNAVLALESDSSSIANNPRGDFLSQFMGSTNATKMKTTTSASSSTPFSILIQKLQDLLSRAEHFEVLTVNNNASENSRSSSTSLLSRQLRLRLSADPDSDIPPTYREMIVSIHAIATFKALDDYLRPRFSLSERPPSASRRREMLQQLASARMAQLSGAAESRLFSPFGQELSSLSPQTGTGEGRPNSRFASRAKVSAPERPARSDNTQSEKSDRKRSLRKSQPSTSIGEPQPPPLSQPESEHIEANLECADEKVLDDDKDDAIAAAGTPEAFVAGLEEDVSDEDESEPGAVNMEVASSGKVTARQDDGTRIFTPQPGTPVSGATRPPPPGQSPGLSALASGLPNSGRPSYAAALASVPQDWHIEFSIDGKVIPNHTTIYRAVHHNRDQPQDPTLRTVWAGVHAVKFRRVKGPPPTQSSLDNFVAEKDEDESNLPASLDGHPITSSILSLLRILHELNASLEDVRDTLSRAGLQLFAEPLASFINTKLTAKMNRQLEEPLIVASNCLPDWAEDLARSFPFLFPFETRHLFLQSTSFGYSRSMVRWQNSQAENDERRDRRRDDRPMMGRPQRQKVRISRSRILESAMKVMEMYGASPSVLEVEYFEEVGTGLGPTLEFYSTVSKEFSKKKLKMWRENDSGDNTEFAFGKNGLFPIPMSDKEAEADSGKKLLHFFKMLGKFVGRSMLDSRIIDISFNPTFFKLASKPSMSLSIGLLRTIDQDLANSLVPLQQFANAKVNIMNETSLTDSQKSYRLGNLTVAGAHVEDLMVDFTLPGYPDIALIENGKDTLVSIDNVELYIDRVLDLSLGNGVRHQIEAFQTGFSQVFSFSSLRAFTPNELVMLFGRVEEDWSIETLMDSVKADHGFNMDSKSVKNLLQTMSELTDEQRRDFLQFVTGSPKLPIGGFKSLTPMFTVVCKPSEPPYTSDDYLPSVMTCVNYLKLPDYSSQKVLKERLGVAIREGQGAFHLS